MVVRVKQKAEAISPLAVGRGRCEGAVPALCDGRRSRASLSGTAKPELAGQRDRYVARQFSATASPFGPSAGLALGCFPW